MAGSLKGQLLLAGRQLRDPNFFRSVVLMVEHNAQGAMGLVLNRPGQARVSGALGEERDDVPPIHDLLFEGGPVEPQALFVVHQIVRLRKGCTTVLPKVYLGGGQDAFEDFLSWLSSHKKSKGPYRVFNGCSGWGPGQLDRELKRGDWMLLPATSEHVFEADPYSLWEQCVEEFMTLHPAIKGGGGNWRWN